MTDHFSEALRTYLDDDRAFATVATLLPDGRAHLTVVWIIRDGGDLVFSTTAGRLQGRNAARDPRVTVLLSPPGKPYVYAEIRGTATVTPDSDHALLNRISAKFTGQDYAAYKPGSKDEDAERIIVRVTPDKVTGRF